MSISKTTDPTARMEHQCETCSRTIKPGERYHRWEGVTDWGWQTVKQCWFCYRLVCALDAIGVNSEDEYGNEAYAWLPEVDWSDLYIRDDGQLWRDRHEQWRYSWPTDWWPEADQGGVA